MQDFFVIVNHYFSLHFHVPHRIDKLNSYMHVFPCNIHTTQVLDVNFFPMMQHENIAFARQQLVALSIAKHKKVLVYQNKNTI